MVQTIKARMLHAHYSPGIDYNNLAICNAAGVFKNGKGLFDDEDSLLNSLSGSPIKENHAIRLSDEFSLYPNPSNGSINIQYNFTTNAEIVFYEIIGREVYKAHLTKGRNIEKIQLPNLVSGIYTFAVSRENNVTLAGKIEIQ